MITWDDVAALAPALADIEVESQDLIIAHVSRVLKAARWGDLIDVGQTYLAAHLGALVLRATGGAGGSSSQAVGPVVSETVGQVSRTYAVLTQSSGTGGAGDASLASTDWGREFVALRDRLVTHCGLVT